MNVDAHSDVDDKATRLNPEVPQLKSIIWIQTLPTVTTRRNPRKRDPLVNFAKSIIMTSDQYMQVVEKLKTTHEEATLEKEKTW